MKTMRNLLWPTFACLALAACAKTNSSGGSSETHFLALCNASCEEGFSCLCGLCTESCDSDDACEALNDDALCQVTADGCSTPMVCDVGCSDDDDCASLGARHTCEAGHCRAPNEDMMSGGAGGTSGTSGGSGAGGTSGGAPDGGQVDPTQCTIEAAAEHLIGSDSFGSECSDLERNTAEAWQCIGQLREENKPFVYVIEFTGTDSVLKTGYVGVPSVPGETEYTVYRLDYDSAGFSGTVDPSQLWPTVWAKCNTFTIYDECETSSCYSCEVDDEIPECGCNLDAPGNFVCGGFDIIPPDECESPSCVIDGVCYPNGASTEDGCCYCEDGGYSCIEPGWCPGWTLMGKRCESDDECGGRGLVCSDELGSGERVCTRECNYGCPTGYGCVIQEVMPTPGEEPLSSMCLKTCGLQDDCSVGGVDLESECKIVDRETRQGYCL